MVSLLTFEYNVKYNYIPDKCAIKGEELNEISDSDEESKIKERDLAIVNKVLLNTEPVQSLGGWEKHTKVFVL